MVCVGVGVDGCVCVTVVVVPLCDWCVCVMFAPVPTLPQLGPFAGGVPLTTAMPFGAEASPQGPLLDRAYSNTQLTGEWQLCCWFRCSIFTSQPFHLASGLCTLHLDTACSASVHLKGLLLANEGWCIFLSIKGRRLLS